MKHWQINIINKKVNDAAAIASRIIASEGFRNEIRNKNDWRFNSGTGEEVLTKLTRPLEPIQIYVYRPKNPWTKAIAYYSKGCHYFNVYKLEAMPLLEIVKNLLHEWCHHAGFNHGFGWFANTKTEEKCLYSVPYYVSENAEKWL